MTVAELLAKASSRELAEWMAYFRLEEEGRKQKELAARARTGVRRRKAGGKGR